MSLRTWTYIWCLLLGALTLTGLAFTRFSGALDVWLAFGVLTVLASVAQLCKAEAPNHVLWYATPTFLFAGALLLDPFQYSLLVTTAYVIEWVKERWRRSEYLRKWYLQPFNVANKITVGIVAQGTCTAVNAFAAGLGLATPVAGVVVAALVFVLFDNVITAGALMLARGVSARDSGVLDLENLLSELVLLFLGGIVAVLWTIEPSFIPLALSPLLVIYRALSIPQLQQEARTDTKTGLYNARYLDTLFRTELERAQRRNAPLAVVMADLDLLRNINNTYGHLAGDVVLVGIAKIIRKTIRNFDIAGRFGGEEFTIILPETNREQALIVAERVRQAIEAARFDVPTAEAPIAVTMSMGIACFPHDATTLTGLTHEADIAVYQAKHQGRNRVICVSDVPERTKIQYAISSGQLPVKPEAPEVCLPVEHAAA